MKIEIDATEVIHLLNTDNLLYSHMLNDCRSVIHQLDTPPIKHAYREQNMVANRLASYAIEARLSTTVVIFADLLGTVYLWHILFKGTLSIAFVLNT